LPLTAVELDGKQGVYDWLIWFPTTTTLPPAIFAEQAAHFISEGSPVKVIDVRRKAIIERLPIPGILEHPIESWESDEEKRGLVARLARLSGFEVSLLVDEDSARNPARVPPMEELRGRLASTGHRVSLISGIDGGYPGYVHAIAPELRCFCWRCALEEESRHFASMMARSSQRAEAEDYSVPRPLPGPEEMIRRLQAVPAGQLPPELRGLPAGSVSRAVVVHKEHKQDNEGIDYYATYAWLDGAGQLRSETVHHGWEGYFGQSSYVARLREGDVLHVVREAGEEHLHERALLTRMDAIPFRGRW
jgi:hypothetical protein